MGWYLNTNDRLTYLTTPQPVFNPSLSRRVSYLQVKNSTNTTPPPSNPDQIDQSRRLTTLIPIEENLSHTHHHLRKYFDFALAPNGGFSLKLEQENAIFGRRAASIRYHDILYCLCHKNRMSLWQGRAGVMAKTVFRARASNFYGNLDRATASVMVIHGQRG